MSTAARIEELRKKFDENPRRYFAPLANELRKAGDLTQAIALCREHLPKQPGHMSGYIVFGQALYEGESLDEARGVFEQALALDPENLIALRHLGDIARRQGDPLAARRWYERVLDADPRNDDIAAQLAALATPAHAMRAIPTPGVAMPVVQAPVHDLRPVSFTPSVPVPMIGTVVPTPDAALRAVDFDEVNARLRTPPIPSVSQLTPVIPTVSVPAPAHDLLDLDAMEVAGDGILRNAGHGVAEAPPTDAAPVHAEVEPEQTTIAAAVDQIAESEMDLAAAAVEEESDPFAFAGETDGGDAVTEDVVDGSADANAALDELSFEEGLAAPDWPDTSELVARVVTPRSVTPPFVDVPVEAADAFGREATDAVALVLPEPEPDIADEELAAAVYGADNVVDHVVDNVVDDAAEELSATDAPEPESSVTELVVDADVDVDADLPWLSAPVTPTEEVEAIADAIAEDARTAGDSDAVSVFALPVAEAAVEGFDETEASFSGLHPEDDTEFVNALSTDASEPESDAFAEAEELFGESPVVEPQHEPVSLFETYGEFDADDVAPEEGFEPDAEEVPSPAFVTETMGELLVTQGFIERAISVYQELVRRRPYDPVLSSRLAELQEQVQAPAPPAVSTDVEPVATSVFTARQRFAALAARRVPRRTPRASVAIQAPDDGLASLFGDAGHGTEDVAARALADAFSPQHIDNGAVTDSFFGATDIGVGTPARGTPVQTAAVSQRMVSQEVDAQAGVAHGVASTESASGAFSFDRFFPDPAAQQASAESNPDRSAVPPTGPSATDDLAQFSAWLKGLGNA
jgi:tetratricopeptide (TPR) repeat protein